MKKASLANHSHDNERRERDYYPTPKNVTHALMDFLYDNELLLSKDVIWEPACGDGMMSRAMESYANKVISTDISEENCYGEGGIDFLSPSVKQKCDAIITNPPFNLSVKFIRKATSTARIVCLLNKSQYWHASKKTPLFNENPPAYVLALNWRPDFMNGERGGSPTMECQWTVWIQGNNDTRYRILEKPSYLK